MRAKILDRSDRSRIYGYLSNRYGLKIELDLGFLSLGNYIRVISKDITKINIRDMRIENLGLLLGEWIQDDLMLSIEGSQLIGPHADRNVAELDDAKFKTWMMGGKLTMDKGKRNLEDGLVIIKHGYDYAGCGELSNGEIWSRLPAQRRID